MLSDETADALYQMQLAARATGKTVIMPSTKSTESIAGNSLDAIYARQLEVRRRSVSAESTVEPAAQEPLAESPKASDASTDKPGDKSQNKR